MARLRRRKLETWGSWSQRAQRLWASQVDAQPGGRADRLAVGVLVDWRSQLQEAGLWPQRYRIEEDVLQWGAAQYWEVLCGEMLQERGRPGDLQEQGLVALWDAVLSGRAEVQDLVRLRGLWQQAVHDGDSRALEVLARWAALGAVRTAPFS